MNDYYEKCAFPKPKTSKKKKLYNGWKDKPNRICEYTGTSHSERHEIFGASNRQIEAAMMDAGYTALQARKTFMLEFGRNYLEPLGVEGV